VIYLYKREDVTKSAKSVIDHLALFNIVD